MKAKNFTHHICLRGILTVLLLGIAAAGMAQTDKKQVVPNVNQDSVLFHSSLRGGGNLQTTSNAGGGMQLMSATSADSYSGSFRVGGNENTFYPVAFIDSEWERHKATILELGRSWTHQDRTWHGSMIAVFRYHTTQWGNASNFIDADIKQYQYDFAATPFIADWIDATTTNGEYKIVIWLKGNTTYQYHSDASQSPIVNQLPLNIGSDSYTVKTEVNKMVNSYGSSFMNLWVYGNCQNYIAGNLGIGTNAPTHKLDVRGTVRANEVVVSTAGADFVFAPDYRLRPLTEVEQFITANKHLPDIAPADSMVQNGVNVSEMQIRLLQKVEELTLYSIEQQRQIDALKEEVKELRVKN